MKFHWKGCLILLIEVWLLLFLIIFIRNKFVQNLEKNNINLYQQYNIKSLFKHWTIYPPLLMVFAYIVFEILIFNNYYNITEYSLIFKQITLFSYIGLILYYNLYDSMFEKYKGKGLIAFITSPFMLATTCLFVGYLMNYIAISINGGMPVYPSNTYFTGYTDINQLLNDDFYILGDHTCKAIPLCDWIDVGIYIASPGDMLVRCYVFVILIFSIIISNKSNKLQK